MSTSAFHISWVLLRIIAKHSGQSGENGPGKSRHSKRTRFWLHFFRFPVFVSIIFAIVDECIVIRPLGEAGSIILAITFAFVCGLTAWLAVKPRSTLPVAGHRGIMMVAVALPFLLVRVIYFLLQRYGPSSFNPVTGNVGALASMVLLMEIIVVIILLSARAVIEPVKQKMREIAACEGQ